MRFLPFCSDAKQGRACIDDLCRTAARGGGETLCGFNQFDYDEMTREYSDEEPFEDDDVESAGEA